MPAWPPRMCLPHILPCLAMGRSSRHATMLAPSWQAPSNRWATIIGHGRVSMEVEAKKLVPGSPEAKVALLHHMLSMMGRSWSWRGHPGRLTSGTPRGEGHSIAYVGRWPQNRYPVGRTGTAVSVYRLCYPPWNFSSEFTPEKMLAGGNDFPFGVSAYFQVLC